MWLHLRPPEQCGFKSHHVPTFLGVGIRKYTFFRPNIDHMPFCYFIDIINFHTVIGMKHSTAEKCVNFSTTFGPVVLQPTTPVTEGCWEIRQTLFVRIVFFYWKTNWDCLVWGGVSLWGRRIGASCPAPKRLQRFWWNFDGIGSRAWSTLWDGWLPPENLVGEKYREKTFSPC